MEIYKNKENLKKVWQLAANGLFNIKETLINNRENDEEVVSAYYTIVQAVNKWWDEIEELPF